MRVGCSMDFGALRKTSVYVIGVEGVCSPVPGYPCQFSSTAVHVRPRLFGKPTCCTAVMASPQALCLRGERGEQMGRILCSSRHGHPICSPPLYKRSCRRSGSCLVLPKKERAGSKEGTVFFFFFRSGETFDTNIPRDVWRNIR